jgi:pyruvate dehydrogenase (quinone)
MWNRICVSAGSMPDPRQTGCAIHLMNGLYEAALDGAPVVGLTGLTFHDLRGVRFQQGVDTVKLMQSVALYNEEVTGPQHALIVGNRACRMALSERGVTFWI